MKKNILILGVAMLFLGSAIFQPASAQVPQKSARPAKIDEIPLKGIQKINPNAKRLIKKGALSRDITLLKGAIGLACPFTFFVNGNELSETSVMEIRKFPQTIGAHPEDVYPPQDNWYCYDDDHHSGILITHLPTGNSYLYGGDVCGCEYYDEDKKFKSSGYLGWGGNIFWAFGIDDESLSLGRYTVQILDAGGPPVYFPSVFKSFEINVVCQDGLTLTCDDYGF